MDWSRWKAEQHKSGSETLAFRRRWGREAVRNEEKRQDVVMEMRGDRFLPSPTTGKWFPLGMLLWSLQ